MRISEDLNKSYKAAYRVSGRFLFYRGWPDREIGPNHPG